MLTFFLNESDKNQTNDSTQQVAVLYMNLQDCLFPIPKYTYPWITTAGSGDNCKFLFGIHT